MASVVTIEGREVEISWTVASRNRMDYRARHGVRFPSFSDFVRPEKSFAAYMDALWLLLPEDEFTRHKTPEDLASKIDHDKDVERIVTAVLAVVSSMLVTAEKKTTSARRPSPGSKSGSPPKTGTGSTRSKPTPTSKRGKKNSAARKSATR